MTSFVLHILAMLFMLLDHLWSMVFPMQTWMTWLGRIAFPLFAFTIAEGYRKTKNVKKYLLRLFIFALISEIPYNLMMTGQVFYPYYQNVIWTFVIAVITMMLLDKVKAKFKLVVVALLSILIVLLSCLVSILAMSNYNTVGVLTVLTFYFFKDKKWYSLLGQLVILYYLNVEIMGGYYQVVDIFGKQVEVYQQAMALLALIPIWLYNGKQGYHPKWWQYFCYFFYPLHMLVIYIVMRFIV